MADIYWGTAEQARRTVCHLVESNGYRYAWRETANGSEKWWHAPGRDAALFGVVPAHVLRAWWPGNSFERAFPT